jgi:thiamine biosynthesis lipoprotein
MRFLPIPALLSVLVMGCAHRPATVTSTRSDLLGTVCTVTLFGGGTQGDLDAAFECISGIDARMSAKSRDSELARVNEAAGDHPVKVSPDTFVVIKEGLEFSRTSDGVFDITVGPLVKLWGIGTDNARVPSLAEVKGAVALIGFQDVVLDEDALTVFLKRKGMKIDLGAIAKGYAADKVAGILRSRGVRHALVNLGGNILTLGLKPDGSLWHIGIQDPEKARGEHLGIVDVSGASVVTSGAYERYFDYGGRRYHHIMDTRSGFPVKNGLLAVTIVCENSMIADGYSTLVFALGLDRGRGMIERSAGTVNAIFVTEDLKVYVSPGIRGAFRLTNPGYRLAGW